MFKSTEFNVENYECLLDVESARSTYTIRKLLIEKLGRLLVKHKLDQLLGISILHKHFDLGQGEVLVRKHDEDRIVTQPEFNRPKLVACHWKVGSNDSTGNLQPIEFLDRDTFGDQAIGLTELVGSNLHEQFRLEFTRLVVENDAENELGLMTLHAQLVLNANMETQTLYEESNDKARISNIFTVKRSEISGGDNFEALWFANDTGRNGIALSCGYHCNCE